MEMINEKFKKIDLTEMDEFSVAFNEFLSGSLDSLIHNVIDDDESEEDSELPIMEIKQRELVLDGSVLENTIASHILSARLEDRLFLMAYEISKKERVMGYE